jgi:hypothetical protein
MHNILPSIDNELDRLRTYREAASKVGVPYFKIQRAARLGILPTYSILNSRKYVKLRDVLRAISPSS